MLAVANGALLRRLLGILHTGSPARFKLTEEPGQSLHVPESNRQRAEHDVQQLECVRGSSAGTMNNRSARW